MLFKNIEQYNLFINSPLEQFQITSLLSLNAPLFGYINLTITNLTLYSFIILYLISYLHVFANNYFKLLPSK